MKTLVSVVVLNSLALSSSAALASQVRSNTLDGEPSVRSVPVVDFVRARCATDQSDVFTYWQGSIFSFVIGEPQRKIFQIVGMNVARCFQDQEGNWLFTSRELNYYLDPETGRVVDKWTNPWTGETVPVVHVANSPVQANYGKDSFSLTIAQGTGTFVVDVPLSYPNALSKDPRFVDYSPEPIYQAGEFFKLSVPMAELISPFSPTTRHLNISWDRTGLWLPWMKMKGKQGNLFYSATGAKVTGFDSLPKVLKDEIASKLPLYKSAPHCYLKQRNSTSWNYFAKNFDAYLEGKIFPLPAAENPAECL